MRKGADANMSSKLEDRILELEKENASFKSEIVRLRSKVTLLESQLSKVIYESRYDNDYVPYPEED